MQYINYKSLLEKLDNGEQVFSLGNCQKYETRSYQQLLACGKPLLIKYEEEGRFRWDKRYNPQISIQESDLFKIMEYLEKFLMDSGINTKIIKLPKSPRIYITIKLNAHGEPALINYVNPIFVNENKQCIYYF